jgi:hypothetical protein
MTQFLWPTSFVCTLVAEKIILPTTYNISISLLPEYQNNSNINIGFKKLRSFVDIKLQNSIFIFKDNPLLESITGINNNIVVFPCEPYDHFVGCVLFQKCLAITEQYFDIDCITIDSLIGDHVQYTIEHPGESGLELTGDFWWNMDTLDTGSTNNIKWDDLNIEIGLKFEPKIVRGGLSENK